MQFFFHDPFLFNDPQLKTESYRPRQRGCRRNNGYCHSARNAPQPPTPTMGFWDQVLLMEEMEDSHRHQQRHRQKRERDFQTPFGGGQDDGFEFMLVPPHAWNSRRRSAYCKGRDCRKPCQTPSPAPTTNPVHAKPNKPTAKSVDPLFELLFANAPSRPRCQRQERRQPKQERPASKPVDPLFESLFSGPPARRQQPFDEAMPLKMLAEEQHRAMKEQSKNTKPTREPKKNVTFETNNFDNSNNAAAFELPQPWHVQENDKGLVLSIDVAGFSMDDLNLQVDPIRRTNAMQLTLKAQRTNSLGQVWELERTKTLNANVYEFNAVEASCDENILQITIPKKTINPTANVNIPIRASNTQEVEEEEKTQDEEPRPFTLPDLLDAMTTEFARAHETTGTPPSDNATKAKDETKSNENQEGMTSVPLTLEDLLEAMAAEFIQAYEAAGGSEASDDSEANNVDIKKDDGEESKQVTPQKTATPVNESEASLQLSPTFDADEVAPTSESDEQKVEEETKPDIEEEQPDVVGADQTIPTGVITGDDAVVPEAETKVEAAAASPIPDLTADDSSEEDTEAKCGDSNDEGTPIADLLTENEDLVLKLENDLLNQEDSFDVLDSKEEEDDHSWEDISASG
mmetsp:Transcript_36524/g.88523  ORF Transcript_36524/g.88523 Transcript_36524/m.88523 type:complete len:630 (+) Transcript_36524:197-2086(+)|eukprot:CAMPEP_0113623806 /NCGR_PEP_ID=MMETSP0017_2-20120614/12256_1 /TAXON_ID=2856 /ORGANISM="Cylindrotheca closterium" /LENGTH=629 /DNA_ID=CAMNT_0000533785 /DNA_START=120 /DNA_END=2009 /DNA_ORIENTATION=- /assembly_acc=CAM_ASM_000147